MAQTQTITSWCNGVPDARVPADDRAGTLGDGLFETVLVRHSQAVWLDEHLCRLGRGCASLDLEFPEEYLRREIDAMLCTHSTLDTGILRVSLGRKSGGGRGYAIASRECNRALQLTSAHQPKREYWDSGIRAYLCKTRLPECEAIAGLKHNNRLPHILARAERPVDAFPEGLMLSQSGAVIEGVSSNVFIVVDGVLQTPALELAGVAGVVREKILAFASASGIPCHVRHTSLSDVYRASELFFCNSLLGIVPAHSLDCLHFSESAITRQIQTELESVWYA